MIYGFIWVCATTRYCIYVLRRYTTYGIIDQKCAFRGSSSPVATTEEKGTPLRVSFSSTAASRIDRDPIDRWGAEPNGAPVEHSPQAKERRERGEQEEFLSNPPIAKGSSPANLTERSETTGSIYA